MKQSDYDNAMATLRGLVVAHQVDVALSPLRVYLSARDSGVGWVRASDIAVTFARSADRLVEVGLALRMTEGKWRNREYRPSPIGLLVFHQHPDLFPKPIKSPGDDPAQTKPGVERRKDLLAGITITLSILSFIVAVNGAHTLGAWLLGSTIVSFLVYAALPTRSQDR